MLYFRLFLIYWNILCYHTLWFFLVEPNFLNSGVRDHDIDSGAVEEIRSNYMDIAGVSSVRALSSRGNTIRGYDIEGCYGIQVVGAQSNSTSSEQPYQLGCPVALPWKLLPPPLTLTVKEPDSPTVKPPVKEGRGSRTNRSMTHTDLSWPRPFHLRGGVVWMIKISRRTPFLGKDCVRIVHGPAPQGENPPLASRVEGGTHLLYYLF